MLLFKRMLNLCTTDPKQIGCVLVSLYLIGIKVVRHLVIGFKGKYGNVSRKAEVDKLWQMHKMFKS